MMSSNPPFSNSPSSWPRRIRIFAWLVVIVCASFLASGPVVATPATPGLCHTWPQVNDGGFGLYSGSGSAPYSSEEGFEVTVYQNQLYVGMEADNSLGARLWRTQEGITAPARQTDWEEVIADANGYPWGVTTLAQVDHIDSLAGFNGYLFASSANRSGVYSGTLLFRSSSGDAGSWANAIPALGPGFGDTANENFKEMEVFDGWLCGGTANLVTGAQVWCTQSGGGDGTDWVQKNEPGFGRSSNVGVYSGLVYGNALYFGVQDVGATPNTSGDDVARLLRTTDLNAAVPSWQETFTGPPGSVRVDIVGELDGYLYISHGSSQGMVILRSLSGDPDSWSQVNIPGMDGDKRNSGTIVDGGALFENQLYVAIYNGTTGVEVWRTDGRRLPNTTEQAPLLSWEQVGGSGLGDRNTLYAELIPFHNALYAWTSNYVTGQEVRRLTPDADCPTARYVILLIADGWGYKPVEAANRYAGTVPAYQNWDSYAMSTFPLGGSYNPVSAWTTFTYAQSGFTDSAAAATALYTGAKTANGRINVDGDGTHRLYAISEKARLQAKAVGAVTTVQISHATPGAWEAHNDARANGYAIADEGLWGDPNSTGASGENQYGGGRGVTSPALDVILGGGHPSWNSSYVNTAILNKLTTEVEQSGAFAFVQRVAGSGDGRDRLLAMANDGSVTRLAALFGGSGGNIEYRGADGSGHNPENPTLAQMTEAGLTVLARDYQGFVLMVEGGAVDWAGHANNLDQNIGELLGFNQAVQTVTDWVDDPATPADWSNTLVMVTGDHETGHLTAGPAILPNVAFTAAINSSRLAQEKSVLSTGRRASWDDANQNSEIDDGEAVYWAWNSGNHVNSLIPLYVKGVGADRFDRYATGADSVRGAYVDNTDLFKLMDAMLAMSPAAPGEPVIQISGNDISLSWSPVTTDVAGQTLTVDGYQIHRSNIPFFRPTATTRLATVSNLSYTDNGAMVGGGARYYVIIPGLGSNRLGPASPTVGVFSFGLTPGLP